MTIAAYPASPPAPAAAPPSRRFLLAGHLFGKGGIQTHLRWLTRALADAGHAVWILPTVPAAPGDPALPELDRPGVVLHRPAGRPGAKWRELAAAVDFVGRCRPHAYLSVGTGWVTALAALAAGGARKIFFEVMDGVRYHWRDARLGVRSWFDEVVGQAPRVGVNFRRWFYWRGPVPTLPAIPEPLELLGRLPAARQRRVPLGTARAAFFSRLAAHKRALWLVQQWDCLKDVLAELHVHGTGPEEPAVREHIRAHGLGGRVFCHGRYPDGQAYIDLLSGYDLTLLPTVGNEGAPLVLLESMACGVPFVASAAGGVPDYGADNPDCLIAALRPRDEFVASIRQMAHRLDRAEVDQGRVQRYYHSHYSHGVLRRVWLRYLVDGPSS
jgi:glycosyltransferase involved in cell wall biosynthesis